MPDTDKRVKWPSTVSKELLEKVRGLSGLTRIPMSKFADEAFSDLIAKYGENANEIVMRKIGGEGK
jgi:hypothetical protein